MTLVTQRWERTFPAMGTECHVIVEGRRGIVDHARQRIAELQAMWTRFDPDSHVMRVNRAGGGSLTPETWQLLVRGLVARRFTKGLFDPFMAGQIVAVGYDRDFASISAGRRREPPRPAAARPVTSLDRRTRTVRFADGAQLDSGGLGKGLAADIVSAEIMELGAEACLVNLGGDLRVRGRRAEPWEIGIENESDAGPPLSVRLTRGALATSSRRRRVWDTDRGPAHHLLDPRTGDPLRAGPVGATAIAPAGWIAEALTKVLMAAPEGTARETVRRHLGAGLLQDDSGGVRQL